jgi:putative PIN family toxin of toxin-antitoxin system
MIWVFDTNVLISAALGDGICRQAFEEAQKVGEIVRSENTFLELVNTLEKPRLQKYLNPGDKIDFLANYLLLTRPITITEVIRLCRDPKDNMFLELLVSSKANALITGDQDLLALNPFRGIPIASAARFLKEFNSFK